jgi:hypothetical protein
MDKETRRKSRQMMQKKDHAPCNNLPKIKMEKEKEELLHPRKLSPQESTCRRDKSHSKIRNNIPIPHQSSSFSSRLVGSARLMSLPKEKKLL